MFSGLMAKISAGLAILSGILFFWAKTERAAKKEAQHENKIHDKINEIEEIQEQDKVEVLSDEKLRVKQKVKNIKSSSRRDAASRL